MARTHRTRAIPRRQVPDQTVTLADPLLVGLEQGELGVQQPAFDLGEPHGSQPRQTRNAEEVAELRRRFAGVELSVDEDVDPVLHHRPDAHQEHSLAKNLLTDPLRPWPDVRGRQQVTAQEVGQDLRVDPIRFNPGLGNRPDLQRMRQVHGTQLPLQHVVHHGPISRSFEDGLRVIANGGHEGFDCLDGVRHLAHSHHLSLLVHDRHV